MDIFLTVCGLMLVVFVFTYAFIKLAIDGYCGECTGNCNQGRTCDCKDKNNE